MSKPKLYIKNEKGRYEPYTLPEPDISDTVYRKINGRYEPIGIARQHDYLTPGVWVVYAKHAFCNGAYLKDKFKLEKVADLQFPTIAHLGGLESAIDQAWNELYAYKEEKMRTTGYSVNDGFHFVAKRTVEILMEKGKKK